MTEKLEQLRNLILPESHSRMDRANRNYFEPLTMDGPANLHFKTCECQWSKIPEPHKLPKK